MLILEVSKFTKLTKKAIEYYTAHGLVEPGVLGNGYRDYGVEQVEALKRIGVLRKLGLRVSEIKLIMEDSSGEAMQSVLLGKELELRRDTVRKELLERLSRGCDYEELCGEVALLEQQKTITEKLLDAFPGFYGRMICLHFERFLNESIRTPDQQSAYETVLAFLDQTPAPELSEDLEAYLFEGTKHLDSEGIHTILEKSRNSLENFDLFMSENQSFLDEYLAYKQSEEYRNSPACRLMEVLKEFNRSSGYNDVFIPAMKRLSPSYHDYHSQMNRANEALLAERPDLYQLLQG